MSKLALITGGSSGLGFELAKNLYRQGYSLILLARDRDKLNRAKKALESIEPRDAERAVYVHACDVAQEEELSRVFREIKKQHDRIDFLVLNAGTVTIDLLSDYESLADVNHIVRVNLVGAMSTTYLSMPMLAPGGHVLFISSGFSFIGPAGYSLYATSKAGMNVFADAMRRELLHRDVQVHLACPGDIETPMYEAEHKMMPDWIRIKMGRATPLSAERVAGYIMKKCFKGRFMIVPSSDVRALMLMQKILPRSWSTFLVDRILPLPPADVGRSAAKKQPSMSSVQ